MKSKFEDITGQNFGFLIVTGMVSSTRKANGYKFAICKCTHCGKENHPVKPSRLKGDGKRKWLRSCGCWKGFYDEMSGVKSCLFKGHRELRGHTWNEFRRSAQRRDIAFNLDIKHCWKLYEKQHRQCALSGLPIEFGNPKKSNRSKPTTASLDRIDNDLPYCVGNVQWVHKDLNIMRNKLPIDKFIDLCKKVVAVSEKK